MSVIMQEGTYNDMGKCLVLSNGIIELVVTAEFGPRIIRAGFVGQKNEFCDDSPVSNHTYGGEVWRMRGGHRFWHSPECFPRTYIADNTPVRWKTIDNGVLVMQESEPWVQMQKSMEIVILADNQVIIRHHLLNKNAWPIKVAAWALSVMAPGGKAVIAQPACNTDLLPNRLIALWPYANMSDKRIGWGEKYIALVQENESQPFKFGINNEAGWIAYFNHGNLFIKRYSHDRSAQYPDGGVSSELYTNDFMLELETLSPLVELEAERTLTHEERWEFVAGVKRPETEYEMDQVVHRYIMKKA